MLADRSTDYNNAGCLMMSIGRQLVALDLFRGALESKLTSLRSRGLQLELMPALDVETSSQQDSECAISQSEQISFAEGQECQSRQLPDCLRLAEQHLARIDDYIREGATATDEQARMDMTSEASSPINPTSEASIAFSASRNSIVAPISTAHQDYNPFLCFTPFPLPEHQEDGNAQFSSAIIIYNLGIIHQWFCRYSPKAPAFFEISAALVSTVEDCCSPQHVCLLLRVSLLNNFSVWSFDNADSEAMCSSLEHLSDILEAPEVVDALPPLLVQRMRRNIRCLLTPEHRCSPAA